MTPAQYGIQLAQAAPPLTADQAEAAARILATLSHDTEAMAA